MTKGKTQTLSDVFRKAMDESGLSLYRIAKDTGIAAQSLLRFRRDDQSLHLSKADVLAAYLGLRLVPDPDAQPPQPTPTNLARPMLARRRTRRKAK